MLKMKRRNQISANEECRAEFEVMCRTLRFPENIKPDESALYFWEKRKTEFPEFHKLAQIVLGTPGTQVSVERLFSLLNYLLSPRKYNSKELTINEILFLKCNLDVLFKLRDLIITS